MKRETCIFAGIIVVTGICVATITGCVYIVNNPEQKHADPVTLICPEYIPPTLKPLPSVVKITADMKTQSQKDDAVVGNIKELRDWGLATEKALTESVEKHKSRCYYK